MLQSDDLCLCSGTVAKAGYEELLQAASRAGFDGLSMWPHHYESAQLSGLSIKDMKLMLDDYGLQLSEFDDQPVAQVVQSLSEALRKFAGS